MTRLTMTRARPQCRGLTASVLVIVTLKEEARGIVLLENGEEIDAVKIVAPTNIFDRSREIGGTIVRIPGKIVVVENVVAGQIPLRGLDYHHKFDPFRGGYLSRFFQHRTHEPDLDLACIGIRIKSEVEIVVVVEMRKGARLPVMIDGELRFAAGSQALHRLVPPRRFALNFGNDHSGDPEQA